MKYYIDIILGRSFLKDRSDSQFLEKFIPLLMLQIRVIRTKMLIYS